MSLSLANQDDTLVLSWFLPFAFPKCPRLKGHGINLGDGSEGQGERSTRTR